MKVTCWSDELDIGDVVAADVVVNAVLVAALAVVVCWPAVASKTALFFRS